MMVKVLALDPIDDAGLSLLRARDDVALVYLPNPTDTEISEHMRDTEALILRARKIENDIYKNAPKLRLISRHGVGCDNLNFDVLRNLGVTVAIASDSNLVSVAEHAMMLTLAACKNLILAQRAVFEHNWSARQDLSARDFAGSKTLVIGFGRIGRAYAERAAAFGAEIVVFDPYISNRTSLPSDYERAVQLENAVAQADIISIHMPRTEETANLFDTVILSQLKNGAILVNTARGGLVDEAALLTELNTGRGIRYATDVLLAEPPGTEDPLLQRDDVIITPHSAAMTKQGTIRMATRSAQNVLDFLDGRLASDMIALSG